MEDDSNLKVRSDLYPRLRQSSTAAMEVISPDLYAKRDANFNNNDTKSDLNNVPQPINEKFSNLLNQSPPPKETESVVQTCPSSDLAENPKCDTREHSPCDSPINDASYACSQSAASALQEGEATPSTHCNDQSPLPEEDDEDERIDVVTPDEIDVSSPIQRPFLSLLRPELTSTPDSEALNKNLYQRLQALNGQDSLKDDQPTTSLDLTGSRASYMFPSRKLSPSPTHDGQPSQLPFNAFGAAFSNLARLHDISPFTEGNEGSLKTPYNPSLYAANLPPHLLPWLISSQLQNFVQYQNRSEVSRSPYNGGLFHEDKDQQPLDLSSKKLPLKSFRPLSDEDLVSRVLEVKPSTRGRKRADNSKRTYTENELHAALKDISSGKLGTRRAAVMYGIPRSTLRNKVYKLTMEKNKHKSLLEQNDQPITILPDSTASQMRHGMNPVSDSELSNCEILKSTIRSRMNDKLDELIRNNQTYLSGGERQKLLDSSLNYLLENLQKLSLNPENKATLLDVPMSSLSLYPQLQEFTHRIVEERFNEEVMRSSKTLINGALSPANGFSDELKLNIPTYPKVDEIKFDLSSSHASPAQTNLKDMIAQIINQKILNEDLEDTKPPPPPTGSYLPLSVQHLERNLINSNLKITSDDKSSQELSKKRAKSPSAAGGGKGSRPKRGKYRNYDRDNLVKAVQAVQSGEMSVHRAGSFYGVPHSTLEYKVKERHLKRGSGAKKETSLPTMVKPAKDPLGVSSYGKRRFNSDIPDTTTVSHLDLDDRSDDISVISVQQSAPKKPKLIHERDPSLSMTSHPFLPNPFPFWSNTSPILAPLLSSQYQTDPLYASQMMRDLQEKLSNNADLRKNSPSPSSHLQDSFSKEVPPRSHQSLSNGGSLSPSPPGSPTINESLLNSLLRKKMEMGEGTFPWPLHQSFKDNTKEDGSDVTASHPSSPGGPTPAAGLFTLNALLPSFLAARSSIAAAVAMNSEGAGSSPPPPTSSALPLVKGPPPMPFVGQHLTEAP